MINLEPYKPADDLSAIHLRLFSLKSSGETKESEEQSFTLRETSPNPTRNLFLICMKSRETSLQGH